MSDWYIDTFKRRLREKDLTGKIGSSGKLRLLSLVRELRAALKRPAGLAPYSTPAQLYGPAIEISE